MGALVDLYFASASERKNFDCGMCRKTTPTRPARLKCEEPGFWMLPPGKAIAAIKDGPKYSFCPGKATWYPELAIVFEQCFVANETGILPSDGSFQDQSELFVEAFPTFVERWKWRWYGRVWHDVSDATGKVFEALGKMLGGKKKGR